MDDKSCHPVSIIPGIRFVDYEDESQLDFVMDLVGRDLSEPYSIFTYRYFLYRFPQLCILALAEDSDEPIGCVVGKMDLENHNHLQGTEEDPEEDPAEAQSLQQQEEQQDILDQNDDTCSKIEQRNTIANQNDKDDQHQQHVSNKLGENDRKDYESKPADHGDVMKHKRQHHDGDKTEQKEAGGRQNKKNEVDESAAAAAAATSNSEGEWTGYIGMLAVRESYRRRGIGKALVRLVLQRMRDLQCTSATLETEVTNTTAQKLYQECFGFVREELLVRYYLNWNDAYRLRLWFDVENKEPKSDVLVPTDASKSITMNKTQVVPQVC